MLYCFFNSNNQENSMTINLLLLFSLVGLTGVLALKVFNIFDKQKIQPKSDSEQRQLVMKKGLESLANSAAQLGKKGSYIEHALFQDATEKELVERLNMLCNFEDDNNIEPASFFPKNKKV